MKERPKYRGWLFRDTFWEAERINGKLNVRHLSIDKMCNVEKAARKDFDQVKALNSLLRIDVDDFYWDSDGYIASALTEGRCYVAKEKGFVKGAMIIERRIPDETYSSSSLAIGILSVTPEDREKGFGTRLVEIAKALAFKENKRLFVECFCDYKNLDYYKKIGFSEDTTKEYNGRFYHVLFLDPRNIPAFPDTKRIEIGDALEYISHLDQMEVIPSDVTFENVFVYDDPQRQISLSLIHDNVIIITRRPGKASFYPPVGNNRLDETVMECFEWAKTEPECSGFTCVPYSFAERLKPETKERLNIIADRDNFDYLYAPRYHLFEEPHLRTQHQNLMHFLNKKPEYKDLTYDMVDVVSDFQSLWMNDYTNRMKKANRPVSDFVATENKAIKKALTHCKSLNLRIGALYLDNIMIGFSIAGIFHHTAYIHFEKALREKGAYQSLIYFFGEAALQGVDTVNKEQDLGITGLRTSKERYQPSGFIEKCKITLKE